VADLRVPQVRWLGTKSQKGTVDLMYQVPTIVVEPVPSLQGLGQVLAFERALVGEEEDQLPLQKQVRTQGLQEGI
jgi:hypothetical protein